MAVGRSSGSGFLDRSPSHPTRCRLDSGSAVGRWSHGLGHTHYGGAPAEELERTPLRTSLPFSPGSRCGPEHLLHSKPLIHEVDRDDNLAYRWGCPVPRFHSDRSEGLSFFGLGASRSMRNSMTARRSALEPRSRNISVRYPKAGTPGEVEPTTGSR